jgi:hypothetical protein
MPRLNAILIIIFMVASGCTSHRISEVGLSPVDATSTDKGVIPGATAWFKDLRSGDCGADLVKITYFADGTGRFEAVTWTNQTHSKDYWRFNITFRDPEGVILGQASNIRPNDVYIEGSYEFPFTTRYIHWQFNSPGMDDRNAFGEHAPKYRWRGEFTYDKKFFDKDVTVWVTSSC